MASSNDVRQIGPADVDSSALELTGTPLNELVTQLGGTLHESSVPDATSDGWRILKQYEGGSHLIGAPADPDGTTWRLAHVPGGTTAPVVHVQPGVEHLRPSRAVRARGLELRWPPMMTSRSWTGGFVIDIVNTGPTRWVPDGDGFKVMGIFTSPEVAQTPFGWVASNQERAFPLEPGEYARVPVTIDQSQWRKLSAGSYALRAVLVGLNLHPEKPLRVELSAERIARERDRGRSTRQTREEQRRSLEHQILQLQAKITAGTSLHTIAEAIAGTDSDEHAISRIATLLPCDDTTARTIYHSTLRELHPSNTPGLKRRIAELTLERQELNTKARNLDDND